MTFPDAIINLPMYLILLILHLVSRTEGQMIKLLGWLGAILVQGAVIPPILLALFTTTVALPPLIMVVMLWLGLLLYLIYSISLRDKIYMTSNGAGFALQSVMLYLVITS
jgi:lipid-A-disaccharide synthase-like uncharacterized protein